MRAIGNGGYRLTVKGGSGRTRTEVDLPLDRLQFEALWRLTDDRRIEKTRRRVELDGHVVEVDSYAGELAGLIVAEIEFSDEAAADAFVAPPWFGREVTDDPRYRNAALAIEGLP